MTDNLPVNRIIFSVAVGTLSMLTVIVAGCNNEFATVATILKRALEAFGYGALLTFVFLMLGEEFAVYKSKRELELLVDEAHCSD